MRKLFYPLIALLLAGCSATEMISDTNRERTGITENLIIITLDGLDWKDVYLDEDVLDRNYLAGIGNLYGNRNLGNKFDVLNPSMKSHPGYAEIFTGNTTDVIDNSPREAINKSVLEFLNEQPEYDWYNVMSVGVSLAPLYIFRPSISTMPILTHQEITFENESYNPLLVDIDDPDLNNMYKLRENVNEIFRERDLMLPTIEKYGGETIEENSEEGELLAYLITRKIMQKLHPKVMYLSFAMTDHFAHLGQREEYLSAARNAGMYIKDLISFVNSDEQYSGNTSIIITTDHGRSSGFRDHGKETFFILISPYTIKGIIAEEKQYYNAQIAQTIANLLGFEYEADHEIAPALEF